MKPLGFPLDETRAPPEATDRLDSGEQLRPEERDRLLERTRGFGQATRRRGEDLRVQRTRAGVSFPGAGRCAVRGVGRGDGGGSDDG
ncbi:hypothetical protein [Streptomyces spinosirectus]